MKVWLPFDDEKAGEHEMKGQRETQKQKENPSVGAKVGDKRARPIKRDDQQAVDRKEIGSQSYPSVHSVAEHMTALKAHMEAVCYFTTENLHP